LNLTGLTTLSQLVVRHESVTIPVHSLGEVVAASFAFHTMAMVIPKK
jgi:hypothetical protein